MKMAPKKRPAHVLEKKDEEIVEIPSVRRSDDPPLKKLKWTNKQRVLIFASRGIIFRARHLMNNLKTLLPHSKPDTKMEKKTALSNINEICEMKHCNKCLYFESRKQQDLYLWMSNVDSGPSMKFLVENIHTMEELKLSGNCLKGSRAILSFDKNFETCPERILMKELLVQIFGTPYQHPKSQPFIDHVFTFSVLDHRIWFRNYQIIEEDGSLVEIGPRFVLNPVCIFEGSFSGVKLWENPKYVSPNRHRRNLKKSATAKYYQKTKQKVARELRKPKESYDLDKTDLIFHTSEPEK